MGYGPIVMEAWQTTSLVYFPGTCNGWPKLSLILGFYAYVSLVYERTVPFLALISGFRRVISQKSADLKTVFVVFCTKSIVMGIVL
jgi:hypothetical protein